MTDERVPSWEHQRIDGPHAVFLWLPRHKRAEYVRAMHGTMVVRGRDLQRAWHALGRAARRAIWPNGTFHG